MNKLKILFISLGIISGLGIISAFDKVTNFLEKSFGTTVSLAFSIIMLVVSLSFIYLIIKPKRVKSFEEK